VPMSRAYTRLCGFVATFAQEPVAAGKNGLCNTFYTHAGSSETLSYRLQMGTKKNPDNDSVGYSEAWWHLLNSIGISGSLAHSTGVTYNDYSQHSFCIGVDTETIAHLASSGENLSNTAVIQLKVSGFGTLPEHLPTRAHLIAQYDSVCEVRDTSVDFFEYFLGL
jgi:hypothetical protein